MYFHTFLTAASGINACSKKVDQASNIQTLLHHPSFSACCVYIKLIWLVLFVVVRKEGWVPV